jgi:hypothetical protein
MLLLRSFCPTLACTIPPAHRTASLIALKFVTTLQVDIAVLRLLTLFHLITSTPTSVIPKIFIVSWSLLLLTLPSPGLPLISEGGIDQAEIRVIRFPSGADSVSASVDDPCTVITRWASVCLAFLSLGNVMIVFTV